jgi:site-specific recombinase XerD
MVGNSTPGPRKDEETGKFLPGKYLPGDLKEYFEFLSATRSKNTAESYILWTKKFIVFLEEKEMRLEDAPTGILNVFVVWLKGKGLTSASIRLSIVSVRKYLKWKRSQGVQFAEFDSPDLPKLPSKEPFVLSDKDLAIFLSKAQLLPEPARTALLLLPLCGLRVSEICEMTLDRILPSKDDKGKVWTVFEVDGKGSKMRFAPIAPQGKKILQEYLTTWRSKRRFRNSNYLFPGKGKRLHLSEKTLQAYVRDIRCDSRLSNEIVPHALRKTWLTKLHRKGVDLLHISKIAGHANIQTTFKYYIATEITDTLKELDKVFK